MPQIIEIDDNDAWNTSYVSELKGLDLSRDSEIIEKEYQTMMQNVIISNEGIASDVGIESYLNVVDGTVRKVHKHQTVNGTVETILITNTSLYRKVSQSWVPIHSGVTTTLDTTESQFQTVLGVTSTTGFAIGEAIGIELDDGTWKIARIDTMNAGVSLNIDSMLGGDAAIGNDVYRLYELNGDDDHPVVSVTVPFADDVIFTNGVDNIQHYDTGTIACTDLAGTDLPANQKAISLAVFDNSLFLLGTTEIGTFHPYRVRWSAPADISDYSIANDGGYQDLFDHPHAILAAAGVGPYLAIYRAGSIVRCVPENSNVRRFAFPTVVADEGIFSSHGVVDIGDRHILVGKRNVYEYQGGFELTPIGNQIAKEFLAPGGLLEAAYKGRLFMLYNSLSSRISIFYPDAFGAYPNKAFVFDDFHKQWSTRDMSKQVTGWGHAIDSQVVTWDDLVGPWFSQDFKWGGSAGLTETETLLLCSADESQTFRYSGNSSGDDGTVIVSRVDTPDFFVPDLELRFDHFRLQAAGNGTITVYFSTDRGFNWTELTTQEVFTVQPITARYENLSGQFIFSSIRFRIESQSYLRIISYGLNFRVEGEKD